MKKFDLMGVEMTSNVSVIPTSTRLCVKAVEAKYNIEKVHDELIKLINVVLEDEGFKRERQDVGIALEYCNDVFEFINAIVDTLADEDDED